MESRVNTVNGQIQITGLPDIVLFEIFDYLPIIDRMQSVSLVCVHWSRLVHAPSLWKTIDLSEVGNISNERLRQLLKKSPRVNKLNISDCWGITDFGIFLVARECPRLTHLDISGCRKLTAAFEFIANLRHLQVLNISHLSNIRDHWIQVICRSCPKLAELDVSYSKKITSVGLSRAIEDHPSLKELKIDHCDDIHDEFLYLLAATKSKLEGLSMKNCEFSADGLECLSKLSCLRYLNVSGIEEVFDGVVIEWKGLERLAINGCLDISPEAIDLIIKNNPGLQELDLGSTNIDEAGLINIAQQPCRFVLQKIILDDNPDVTEYGVEFLLEHCPRLQIVSLVDCKFSPFLHEQWKADFPEVMEIKFRKNFWEI